MKASNSFSSSLLRAMPAAVLLLSLVLSETPSFLLMAIGAVIFHELGHAICFLIGTGSLPSLRADGFGFKLISERPLNRMQEAVAAAGGPLCNLLLGILLFRTGNAWCISFGAIHFLYALFNLLPIAELDGAHLLRFALSSFLSAKKTNAVCLFLTAALASVFFFFSLFSFYYTGMGLCGAFFALFVFPWHPLFAFDDLRENARKHEF